MELIKGISKETQGNCTLYHITSLTDEIKEELRRFLSVICYGEENVSSGAKAYSYKNTLKEFLLRCQEQGQTESSNRIKGFMGELLTHLLFRIEDTFQITSACFNLEERSFKKGFDIIVFDNENNEIWITEVKSGEKKAGGNASSSIKGLLNRANNDLVGRLNENNRMLWDNAIHTAKNAMSSETDEKKAVLKILRTHLDRAVDEEGSSSEHNVILCGNLFHTLLDKISIDDIQEKYDSICEQDTFKGVLIIATQKNTYQAIYDFLKSEAQS